MNDIRKLMEKYISCDDCMGTGSTDTLRKCSECDGMGGWYEESVDESQLNEVDEYTAAGALFQAGFEAGFNAEVFTENEIKKAFREFTNEKYSRGDLGHENTLGNDHEANFGGWPDEQR